MYNLNKTIMRKRFTLALLSLLLVPLGMMAQTVTVGPESGNLIAALSESSQEVGFARGWRAMWRHEQLPLNLVTGDNPDLTVGGELKIPAGNMNYRTTDGVEQLLLIGGSIDDSYFVLSLPKGYRFKGYKIELLNNMNGESYANFNFDSATKTFVEHSGNFSGAIVATTGQMAQNNETKVYTIERTSLTADDMGNQLYFHLVRGSKRAFLALTVKSFTVYFTAEGTFEAEAKSVSKGVARSMVTSPFSTNKIDIGAIQPRKSEDGTQTFYAYTYSNVKDLDANVYIYQSDAVLDGVPMDVAATKKIYPVEVDGNEYFAFGNGVYYAEAPTQVYSQTGLTYPVGFRVVGAKFTPQWGTETPGGSEVRYYYYITYTSGGTTYYLNDQLRFTTNKFGWYYDETNGAIYTGSGANIRYLSCEGNGLNTRTLSFSTNPPSSDSSNPGYYDLIVYTRGRRTYIGWNANYSDYRWYLTGTTVSTAVPTVVRGNNTNAAGWVGAGQQTVTFPTYKPGAYTLNVYDKTGATVVASKTVNSSADAGTAIDLSDKATYGYNNDAIKFEISGLPEGCTALVDVSLFMQALNPYIDQMSITCHDSKNQLSLSQPFTANDFKVAGEAFNFYIPDAYKNADLTFTFEDLWSQYGDNTYYTGALKKDGYARYSFVTSPYFEKVDQNEDNGLYNNPNYSPDASYVDKVKASKAGNIRFKFNNAENLDSESGQTTTSYLEEYPFTVANYIGSEDPDGGTVVGALEECTLNAQTAKSDTYYLFTADETRYNIAPSSAWQHRYYAFYRMDINLETHTYDPKLTWTKVYDKTCYNKDGQVGEESMWGLKLSTVDHDTQQEVTGYLTVDEINDAITTAIAATGEDHPTDFKQIIYVDGSDLYSILSSGLTLQQLKAKFAENSLFYLPANTTSTLDNFAYKPNGWATGNAFRAGKDIVLTDNRPFYAPYDIQVDTDNKAMYKRLLSKSNYDKEWQASLIMPYVLKVDNGVHTNVDGTKFTLHTMQAENALKSEGEGLSAYAFFPELKEVDITEANKPYFVKVDKDELSSEGGVSFVVSQTGTLIKATTGMSNDYTFVGTSSNGTITKGKGAGSYKLTPTGSYSGQSVDKTKNIFYFANSEFVNSADYNYNAQIKFSPFRAFYSTEGTTANSMVNTLSIVFGEGIGDEATGIETIENGVNSIDINAPVYDLQGRKMADSIIGATLTRGIYVIKGQKFIVK